MSKTVGLVIDYLENAITTAIEGVKKSPNQYTTENNSAIDKFVYAVRAGSLSASSQRFQEMNVTQNFEVELIKSFSEASRGDKEVSELVLELFDYHEKIFQKIALRNSTEFRILSIEEFSASDPEIDRIKKTASITYSYRIHYRKELK